MNDSLEVKYKYIKLREELDKEIQLLEKMHSKHLACKKGCDLCCLNFSVFPVEFEVIREETGATFNTLDKTTDGDSEKPGSCAFLINHACSIYHSRPIICRTHGLPLLYMNNDDWELSHCELNFTTVPEDFFDDINTFSQDKWNSRLYMLNQEFINEQSNQMLKETDLIPLNKLNL